MSHNFIFYVCRHSSLLTRQRVLLLLLLCWLLVGLSTLFTFTVLPTLANSNSLQFNSISIMSNSSTINIINNTNRSTSKIIFCTSNLPPSINSITNGNSTTLDSISNTSESDKQQGVFALNTIPKTYEIQHNHANRATFFLNLFRPKAFVSLKAKLRTVIFMNHGNGMFINTMDQITIKTPSPKCRLYGV
jgi:hypothetical protein